MLNKTYWAENIPIEIICKCIENSECLGLYEKQTQIGFIRIISDWTTFAYLSDFVISEGKRCKGLGKWMLECVFEIEELKNLRLILK
jgi:hypothetical protein